MVLSFGPPRRLRFELPADLASLPGWVALEGRPAVVRPAGPRALEVDLGASATALIARP